MNLPLAGRCILVTRPAQQSAELARSIRDAGGEALVFSALEIQPLTSAALAASIDHLDEFDGAIFISPNAACHGVAAVRAQRHFPIRPEIYALGPGTARELASQGVPDAIYPDGQDSEALLALPQLRNMAGKAFVIFRGEGGRDLLADTLKARGARVEYAECYRRMRPTTDATPILQRWSSGAIHAVTIASAETLHNLTVMLGETGAGYLRTTPVFAPHEKIATAARAAGIRQVIVTAGGDAGLLSGLMTWFQTHA
ncbi:MAG: uroporphyrinogen-III synthase [Thiobacillaceae bacterium]